jgi:acylphosphatase
VTPRPGGRSPEAEAAPIRRRVLVSGRVQAVGFRASCYHRAVDAGVGGWVRNLADGRVEAAFEGHRVSVEDMVSWCRLGPPLALVTSVSVVDEPTTGEVRFVVT